MFEHSITRLKKSKRTVAGRFTLLPDIFFIDPENVILTSDSTIVAHIPRPGIGLIALLLAALLLFAFLTILGGSVLGSEAQLDRSEATVQGLVTQHIQRSMSNMNQGVLHYLTFRYGIPGATLTKEQFVTEATYNKLADGDIVTVKYLPTDPKMAELIGSDSTNALIQNGYFMFVFGVIGVLLALIFLVFHVRQFWRDDVLIRKGQLLMGEVLKCSGRLNVTKTSIDKNDYGGALRGNYFVELTYTFPAPNGKNIESTVKAKRNDLLHHALPELGIPVAILYLNDRHYKLL